MTNKADALERHLNVEANRLLLLEHISSRSMQVGIQPWWLESDFWERDWHCDFGGGYKTDISWDIRLDSGISLENESPVSATLRHWVGIQGTPTTHLGHRPAPGTAYCDVLTTTRLIDYFFLHHDHGELHSHLFHALTANDFTRTIVRLASFNNSDLSIYDWPEKLKLYLLEKIEHFPTETDIEEWESSYPGISQIDTPEEDFLLNVDPDTILKMRISLLSDDLCIVTNKHSGLRVSPNVATLTDILYRNTLGGKHRIAPPPELCWGNAETLLRERRSVLTRLGDTNERLCEKTLRKYVTTLKTMRFLPPSERPPKSSLAALSNESVIKAMNAVPPGQFISIPTPHLLYALKRALELFINHADHILDSFVRVATEFTIIGAHASRVLNSRNFPTLIRSESVVFGIKRYSLMQGDESVERSLRKFVRLKKATFYSRLRENRGLLESARLVYGCIAFTLGALATRRRGEVVDLIVDKCLDETETSLIIELRKVGLEGHRRKVARPILPIVVKMIKRLQKFQADLLAAGCIDRLHTLLSFPTYKAGVLTSDGSRVETCMDLFMDYIEMPCDGERRYYVRFHPLRRFLPQIFMESGNPHSVEILSWFLGHTDPEQIWAYIREICPRNDIYQSAAQTVSKQLREQNPAYDDLAKLVRARYGVRDFWAVSEETLNGYIYKLQQDGSAEVDFEYFVSPIGKHHRMLVKVLEVA